MEDFQSQRKYLDGSDNALHTDMLNSASQAG